MAQTPNMFGILGATEYRNAPGVAGTTRGLATEGLVPMQAHSIPTTTEDAIEHAIFLFWERVRIPDDRSQCWEWLGSKTPKGYGSITAGRRPNRLHLMAHRLSYEIHVGPIPDGLNILHSCDNRGCVNPAHLSPGTQKENIEDMDRKSRRVNTPSVGVANGSARITEDDVRQIRRRYVPRDSQHGRSALAEEFGVSVHTVSAIVRGLTWQHVK